jgi:predicted permease
MLIAPIRLDETKYDRLKSQEFFRQLSERAASLPGVQFASLVDNPPISFMGSQRSTIEIEGYQPRSGEDLHLDMVTAGPRYFTNMKVPFMQGRDFDERDREGAPCVAVVNEAFVQRYFAGTAAPLGKRLMKYAGERVPKTPCEVVGVIRDDQWHTLEKEVRPFFALAHQQSHRTRSMLLVSTTGDPKTFVPAVREVIRELDRNVPVADVQTLGDFFSIGLFPFRILAVVMAACGFMALLLAILGIYGVVSYSVAQRTREVGIRMALGALQKDILVMVIRQGMALVIAGLGLGFVLSLVLTRVLTSSLIELELPLPVTSTDPLTFASVTALLALVALIACYIPARRATKVDPIEALRYE